GVGSIGHSGGEDRHFQADTADRFDGTHEVGARLLWRNVAAGHHGKVAAIETEVAEHHAHGVILDFDQVLRKKTDGGRRARLRSASRARHARAPGRLLLSRGGHRDTGQNLPASESHWSSAIVAYLRTRGGGAVAFLMAVSRSPFCHWA